MKNILRLSNIIPFLLVVYITKGFIVPPSLYDFGIILIMSVSFLYKLKLDKESISYREELEGIISQLENNVNDKVDKLQKIQDKDRLYAEGKFSTLSLNMQHKGIQSTEKGSYGWGR